jgi:phosphonate transport system permease protein
MIVEPSTKFESTGLGKVTPFFSILVPGSSQIAYKKTWRGITILIFTAVLSFMVNWSYTRFEIGKIQLNATTAFSWLVIPLVLFYLWNILDSFLLYRNRKSSALVAFLSAAVILYVIGWSVTGVKLDRLVTRFPDARTVMNRLVNPDFFSTYEGEKVVVCSWGCLWDYTTARIMGTEGPQVFVSDNVGQIFGKQGTITAPFWRVLLGQATKNQRIPGFETGKIVETIAIGLMATLFSTVLAVPVSFLAAHNIMRRVPGGNVVYTITRTIMNIVRAIDTVVWGLVIIVWVGLGSFAGVIALTIHSIAALGKLFSEEIEHIDPGPVEAIEATGGNFFQVVRYAVIPQVIPSFLSFTLLRWDINMRSATVIGFVAGGGIGFFVLETIRMGGYQQYAAALWVVAVVIILVDFISSRLRFNILKDQPKTVESASPVKKIRNVIYALLGLILFIYFWDVTRIDLSKLFDPGPTFGRLIGDFITIDLSAKVVDNVVRELIITTMQAFMATSLGGILAIPFSFLAAKNLTGKSKFSAWIYYLTRSAFNILRSIEALLYVAIFVFWVGIGPFAGMLALAITTFALMGKLFSEAIENIDPGPIEATTAAGANKIQAIVYAIIPQIVPPFLSYLIYQWDINIRMATIIGFAGGGGIGLMLSTYFGSLQYHKAGTVIAAIVIIVAVMDFASAKIRENFV